MNNLLFRSDNTRGYTLAELVALNSEWHERVEAENLEPDTDEWLHAAKLFADEIASR